MVGDSLNGWRLGVNNEVSIDRYGSAVVWQTIRNIVARLAQSESLRLHNNLVYYLSTLHWCASVMVVRIG